jgi:hypothetical protein
VDRDIPPVCLADQSGGRHLPSLKDEGDLEGVGPRRIGPPTWQTM